jgi:hypothetical protein
LVFALAQPALAADDEIMVTDGDLAKIGRPELEVHTNFSQGTNQSPGDKVFAPNDVLRTTPELSIGLSQHWDAGMYLLTSWVPGRGLYFGGVRLRTKFIGAHELSENLRIYYGLQLEAYDLEPGISADRTGAEVKAIAGAEFGKWEATVNLAEQKDIPDSDLIRPGYAVSAKLVRDIGNGISAGLEHYVSWSSTNQEAPIREIDNMSFLTAQWKLRDWNLHLGVGHGWGISADHTVVKLVIGIPLNY